LRGGRIRLWTPGGAALMGTMKEVCSHHDLARLGYYKTVLDEAGIPNLIRHESLYNLAVPFAVMPSLCVRDDEDYDRALELLRSHAESPPVSGADWSCGSCGEAVPASFDSCWKCGAVRVAG
jgi:hypothetical protein